MNKNNNLLSRIEDYEKDGIQFSVDYLVELFDVPIMNEGPSEEDIKTPMDLIRLSSEDGFDEIYTTYSEIITGISKDKQLYFARHDFLEWQLKRCSAKMLYHLAAKIDSRLASSCDSSFEPKEKLLDFEEEYEKDPEYAPEEWLNENITDENNRKKGFDFIERLRQEKPTQFYKLVISEITDSETGILSWLESETESDDDLNEIRYSYSEWQVPLMIVFEGEYKPYIELEENSKLIMDGFYLNCMYIRNYDEGEKLSSAARYKGN